MSVLDQIYDLSGEGCGGYLGVIKFKPKWIYLGVIRGIFQDGILWGVSFEGLLDVHDRSAMPLS